jgi:hypothetical protein
VPCSKGTCGEASHHLRSTINIYNIRQKIKVKKCSGSLALFVSHSEAAEPLFHVKT